MSLFQIDAGKEWRGGQRQSLLLARGLKELGYSFHFVVQPGSPLHELALKENLPVIPLKMRSEVDVLAISRLAVIMKKRKCNLVHFHDAHSISIGSSSASLAKVPLRILTRRVDFELKKNFFSKQKYTKNIDCIIAISTEIKKVLMKSGINSQKIKVIPSGIDLSVYKKPGQSNYLRKEFSFKESDYLVGIVAHLADHKGHKYLLQAAEIIKKKAPNIKIIIVGEGPLKMELSRQSEESQITDMVYFLGFRKDIPEILGSLNLFVLSSYLEGLGTSLMDAMASRLPIVATQAGGIPEIVIHNETGLLVPPRNPQQLASAILYVYKNNDVAEILGNNGYERVYKKFSAQAMASKVIGLYENLAQEKGIKLHVSGQNKSS